MDDCVSVAEMDDCVSVAEMEDCVSAFIVATCRIIPKPNTDVLDATHSKSSGEEHEIACGSTAEFFIQPLQSCIGDIDALRLRSHCLVFTDENPVLSFDMRYVSDMVCCFSIEPYHDYPSFVRLRHFGHLRYNWSRKIFEFFAGCRKPSCRHLFQTQVRCPEGFAHNVKCSLAGPAFKYVGTICGSYDNVASMWRPQWPKEAKNWTLRRRKYGWPTTAVIHEVIQNGCHVVFAKHPACRNDEHQCRLSFSVAEVVLLQSWTQIQQIVYHMLRFFAKRELIRKDCPKVDEVLCTYHFKTLMLWSCEQMSSEWWISSSVIEICCNLLQKLVIWMKQKRCSNYFIPTANLFHEHFNRMFVDETVNRLIYFCDSDVLSLWFVKHYMRPVFPQIVNARSTQDVLRCVNNYLLHTCEARKAAEPKSIDLYFSLRFFYDVDKYNGAKEEIQLSHCNKYILRVIASNCCGKNDFPPTAEIESCFYFYTLMLFILQAAHLLDCKEWNYDSEWFVEMIRQLSNRPRKLRSKHHNFPKPCETGISRSQLLLLKAERLMENLHVAGLNDGPEFKLLYKMSSSLLRKALDCQDSKTNTVANAILAYMAGLHFAASEFETAIDICSRLIANQTPEKENSDTLNAGCLLYIEELAKIIGFYLIFKQVKYNFSYNRKWVLLDLRITPKVFARYLTISSIEETARGFGLDNIFQTPKLPLDAMLMSLTNQKCSGVLQNSNVYQRCNPIYNMKEPTKSCFLNKNDIIQLLVELSLENMTSFYNGISQDFGIHCSTVDCYHAAYLYKCRNYPEVLHLCERILNEPDIEQDLKERAFANVMVLPPLHSYFDRDVQYLLGLDTLVYYLSPLNEDLGKIKLTSDCTFEHFFARTIYSEKRLLSKVLREDYIIKCHYFLGRHFLARYLKVRCLIDYCNSLSEAMIELEKLKTSLPFEHIIRCFLQQQLRQHQKGVNEKHCAG